nr:SCO3374 family protein [Streptomyces sp. MUM 136J]
MRRWYEDELGWPTLPGEPLRLPLGVRFDVLDVPAAAGRAALRRVPADCPVALRGDRMVLLVAAGSAEELPGLLEWLEWGGLPLDLRALGTGAEMGAPPPPAGPGSPVTAPARTAAWDAAEAHGLRSEAPAPPDPGPAPAPPDPGPAPAPPDPGPAPAPPDPGPAPAPPDPGPAPAPPDPGPAPAPPDPGPASGSPEPEPLALSRSDTVQPTAVWLRPPVPGCEVEASLPSLTALGSAGGTPDLVRLVDTVATHCHRIRLRRTCVQPLAFS